MAKKKKKSQVPTPPRSVQAPKRRETTRAPRDPGQTRLLLGGLAGGLLLVAAVVVVVLVARGGDDEKPSGPVTVSAGCVEQTFASVGRNHVLEVKPDFKYNSFPPTSGPHFPETAIYNAYSEPVPQIRLIHNLEHGAVVVQYGDKVAAPAVDQIIGWYRADPNGIIVAPLPELGDKIVLTAWQHLLTCTQGFDEKAFSDFREAHRFNGPERFSPDAMSPGSQ